MSLRAVTRLPLQTSRLVPLQNYHCASRLVINRGTSFVRSKLGARDAFLNNNAIIARTNGNGNAAAAVAGIRHYSPITEEHPAKIVEYEQVKKLSKGDNPDLVIVDVREPDEYAEGHIPHAINIPLKSSPGALGLDKEEFQDLFGFDKPPTDKTMLFYCLAGVRSTAAEQLASTYGYDKRLNYKGSWEDWAEHEKSSSSS